MMTPRSLFRYLGKRLNERSTWVSLSSGITGASGLPMPWKVVFCGLAIIGVLLPDGDVKH